MIRINYQEIDQWINSLSNEELKPIGFYREPGDEPISMKDQCLRGEANFSLFNKNQELISFNGTGINIYDRDKMVARDWELNALTDKEMVREITKVEGWCDGGDDLDDFISSPTSITAACELYLKSLK